MLLIHEELREYDVDLIYDEDETALPWSNIVMKLWYGNENSKYLRGEKGINGNETIRDFIYTNL